MGKFLGLFICLLISVKSYSQLSFTNGGKMIITGSSNVVVSNPIPNGNTWDPGSGIITLSENAKFIMNTGSQTGIFQVPFLSSTPVTIPFTYNILTAGDINGRIEFSSWYTDDNNNPLPASMINPLTTYGDPLKVIDRFWSINVNYTTTKPTGEYTFTYDENEMVGNFIVESQLVSQRYNDIDDTWGDWLYSPTANIALNTVDIEIQNIEDQYTIWTLVDNSDPLPIELARFVGECYDSGVRLSWTTFTEINNDFFILEKSKDGYLFEVVEIVEGSGNTNYIINYVVIDDVVQSDGTSYYRLKDVDINGNFGYSQTIAVTCYDENSLDIVFIPNPTDGLLQILNVSDPIIKIFDSKGSEVKFIKISEKEIDISNLSYGTYMLNVYDSNRYKNLKIIKR